jgi:DNA-directed RNA polymerase specialized sigma24 family protein
VRLARLTLLHAGDGSPAAALNAVRALRRRLDDMEREAVILARANGWSWRDVGEVLGVSSSTAHQRFARADVPPRRRRRS